MTSTMGKGKRSEGDGNENEWRRENKESKSCCRIEWGKQWVGTELGLIVKYEFNIDIANLTRWAPENNTRRGSLEQRGFVVLNIKCVFESVIIILHENSEFKAAVLAVFI